MATKTLEECKLSITEKKVWIFLAEYGQQDDSWAWRKRLTRAEINDMKKSGVNFSKLDSVIIENQQIHFDPYSDKGQPVLEGCLSFNNGKSVTLYYDLTWTNMAQLLDDINSMDARKFKSIGMLCNLSN
jgi:hypothetical protein